jgi:uncharacterized protein YqeY
MSIQAKLRADLTEAMRRGDDNRKAALRLTLAEIKNAEVSKNASLTDDEQLALLKREVKRRRETIEELEAAGNRLEMLGNERAQIAFLEAYLPRQLSREEIEERAKAVIGELGIVSGSPAVMGTVMKRLMPLFEGQADGKLVQEVVRDLLANRT